MLKRLKALLTSWDRDTPSRRQHRRWSVAMSALVDIDDTTHYCTIRDISPRGARLQMVQDVSVAECASIAIDIEGYGVIPARVCYANGGILRVIFLHDDDGVEALARWLFWLKPQRRQTRYPCRIAATLSMLDREFSCTVVDLSRNGAGITMTEASHLVVSSEVLLCLPDYGSIAASVRHIDGDAVGLALIDGYHGDLPPAASGGKR